MESLNGLETTPAGAPGAPVHPEHSERVAAAVAEAADMLRARLPDPVPSIAITMGSGLGTLADRFENADAIPYAEIPGWPLPTVEGHSGELILGRLGGVPVLGVSGRVHTYEGHPPERTGFYVRVLGQVGLAALFLSNAAGAIRPGFAPGQLMLIRDHLNLLFRNPLLGPLVGDEPRWTDLHQSYDPILSGHVRAAAASLRVPLQEGVYAAVAGPSFETPAEIRMLARLGADAAGMSTVPEVIVARANGIRCVAVSCLSNYAAGLTSQPLNHEEVMEVGAQVADDFAALVSESVVRMAREIEEGAGDQGSGQAPPPLENKTRAQTS